MQDAGGKPPVPALVKSHRVAVSLLPGVSDVLLLLWTLWMLWMVWRLWSGALADWGLTELCLCALEVCA